VKLQHKCTGAGKNVSSSGPSKRKLEVMDEDLADSQKKALMTRKNRKMYEGLRRREDEKAARIVALERKRDTARVHTA
jgi:hypothetical protein